jgi:hypothetical protein
MGAVPMGFPGAPKVNPDYPYMDADEVLLAAFDSLARDTEAAKNILDLGLAERAKGKRFPFFHYLFVDATTSALGAKQGVWCHRCRTPKERNAALRAWLRGEEMEGDHDPIPCS